MTQTDESFDPYYHWLGIPPEEQPPNHYRLLGIQLREENRHVIQNAADRQMAHLRTFQAGPHSAMSQKMLNEVAAARVCLLSTEKKAEYDEQFRQPTARGAVPPDVPAQTPSAVEPQDDVAQVESAAPAPVVKTGKRRRSSRLPIQLAATSCVLVALVGIVALAFVMSRPASPAAQNRLVLNWPESERSEANIVIDGRPFDLAAAALIAADKIELELEPGEHHYRISRPKSRTLKGRFHLKPGQRLKLDVVFTVLNSPKDAKNSSSTTELVLLWPVSEREGCALEIDGKTYDLTEGNVEASDGELRITVPRGRHNVAVLRDGKKVSERVVQAGSSRPVALSNVGTLELRWRTTNRQGFTLFLADKQLDIADPKMRDDGSRLEWDLPAGKTVLQIKRGETEVASQPLTIVPGKRCMVHVDALVSRHISRVVLRWPSDQRTDAILEIDGETYPLPHDEPENAGTAADEVFIDLEPGEHTIRVSRPGYETVERKVPVRSGTLTIVVDALPIVAATISPEQLTQLQEDYVKTYTRYQEFSDWNDATEESRKDIALNTLLSKMTVEARNMERYSPQQYVALDQAYQLATEQNRLVTADGIIRHLRSNRCISEEEQSKRQQQLWDRAVSEAEFEAALAYFRAAAASGRTLAPEEQQTLGDRIIKSDEIDEDYRSVDRLVASFESSHLVTPEAATQLRADVFLRAAKDSELDPPALVELAETMLEVVPELLHVDTEPALTKADQLVDGSNALRRKVIADPRSTSALRPRVEELKSSAKTMQEEVARYQRIASARDAVAAGNGTATQQKLLGLWLLEKSRFEEALPHLRLCSDTTLAAIAQPLPETAGELSKLADAIEIESKKTKYPKRSELALLAYAAHVRQLASSREDESSSPGAVETSSQAAGQDAWIRLPRGSWQKLAGAVTLEALRQSAERPIAGAWSVLDDGTIMATQRGASSYELPVRPQGGYAIRYVCQSSDGSYVSVNLPLGDRSVVFALGAFGGRFSGLQLIDGKNVDDPQNIASIDRSKFRLRRDTPVQVEIHVELMPVKSQSSKQRKLTGGVDWVRITVMINGTPMGAVSTAASRFSAPPEHACPPGSLGFLSGSEATFGGVCLKRK